MAFLGVGFVLSANTTAQTIESRQSPRATISGSVTLQGKGVSGVVVGVRSDEPGPPIGPILRSTTDELGNYRIAGISPGQCLVIPMAPAFVVTDYSVGSTGKIVMIGSGENVEGIDFVLTRGGVVTGKVTDADGRPIIEERLSLIQADQNKPAILASPNWPKATQTDDRGIYRLFGIPAGHYRVAVGLLESRGVVPVGRRQYQQTFFPGTTNFLKAGIVEVSEGGETANVDIVIGGTVQSFSANGQILDETERPLSGLRCGLARLTGDRVANFVSVTCFSNGRGQFEIAGLLPGRYAVFVEPHQIEKSYSEPVRFEIQDKDVDGLLVKTTSGASLAGRVVIDGADKAMMAKLTQMRLNLYVDSPANAFPNWHAATINPDGSFYMEGIQPGTASFNVVTSTDVRLTKNLLILYTERYGIEQSQGIRLTAGDRIDGLTVRVANGTGVVRGEMKYENGSLPAGLRVAIRVTRTDKTSPLTGTEVDARGRFLIPRLPAGSYWFDVDAYVPLPNRRPPSIRQQVDVSNGTITEITFTIDLNPESPVHPEW